MRRPMPELDRLLSIANVAGSEVLYTVKLPSGETQSVNMTAVLAEICEAIRAMEKLIEQRNIPDSSLGGLGREPLA